MCLGGRCIARLKFPDDSSGTVVVEKLADGDQQLIHCFIAFFSEKIADGNPIHSDWQNLAEITEFQEFKVIGCVSCYNAWCHWCNVSCNETHNASHTALNNALDNDRDTDRFDLNDDNGINPVVIPRNGIAVVVAADPIPNDPEEGAMDPLDGENTSGQVKPRSESSRLDDRVSSSADDIFLDHHDVVVTGDNDVFLDDHDGVVADDPIATEPPDGL